MVTCLMAHVELSLDTLCRAHGLEPNMNMGGSMGMPRVSRCPRFLLKYSARETIPATNNEIKIANTSILR